MEHQDSWVQFDAIEWNDPKFNKFNIDTRDFHVGYVFKKERHPEYNTISKYPRYFYTEEEVKTQIERLYTESGGEGEWRMLELESKDERVLNWNMKYIRIWRTDLGFIVCNQQDRAIPKEMLALPVHQEYLHHSKK